VYLFISVLVKNNSPSLNDRINYNVDSLIPFDTLGSKGSSSFKGELVLRAEVLPPVFGGSTLRASHIYISGDYAYIAYNKEGSQYLGGIEVVDISNTKLPKLKSQALFLNTDISACYFVDGRVYLAEATEDENFNSPAVLEVMEVPNGVLQSNTQRVELNSFAATWVSVFNKNIYVSTGNTGGLHVLNQSTLAKTSYLEYPDARCVVNGKGNDVVLMQGTPARITIFNESLQRQAGYTLDGANIPESKSNIDCKGDIIYVAAGDKGAYGVDYQTGAILFNVPTPDNSGKKVCNSVSVFGNTLVMGFGEAGLYAAEINGKKIGTVRNYRFTNDPSSNHVFIDNKMIFVASGLGGFKIVEYKNN
jgi:hypothetical protein